MNMYMVVSKLQEAVQDCINETLYFSLCYLFNFRIILIAIIKRQVIAKSRSKYTLKSHFPDFYFIFGLV